MGQRLTERDIIRLDYQKLVMEGKVDKQTGAPLNYDDICSCVGCTVSRMETLIEQWHNEPYDKESDIKLMYAIRALAGEMVHEIESK